MKYYSPDDELAQNNQKDPKKKKKNKNTQKVNIDFGGEKKSDLTLFQSFNGIYPWLRSYLFVDSDKLDSKNEGETKKAQLQSVKFFSGDYSCYFYFMLLINICMFLLNFTFNLPVFQIQNLRSGI